MEDAVDVPGSIVHCFAKGCQQFFFFYSFCVFCYDMMWLKSWMGVKGLCLQTIIHMSTCAWTELIFLTFTLPSSCQYFFLWCWHVHLMGNIFFVSICKSGVIEPQFVSPNFSFQMWLFFFSNEWAMSSDAILHRKKILPH